ncbi:MAG: hydrogenase maturation nickel metallochaperone HypA [Verrucomicrobiales bacterium]
MHELSIATHIVDTLTSDLADNPGKIVAVRLDVGVLSGVVPDALQFAWDVACEGSRLAGSELRISEISAVAHCPRCEADRPLDSIYRLCCPVCDEWTPEIVAGRELHIRAVEMEASERSEAADRSAAP